MQARRVDPNERFQVQASQGRYRGSGLGLFRRGSCYYRCPACGRRTLVRRQWLDAWNPTPSPLPQVVQDAFNRVGVEGHQAVFDFRCGGCDRPVRLLFWEQETGMGGQWFPLLKAVVELDDDDVEGEPTRLR